MKINKTSGLLECAEFISSPNCDDRPPNIEPNLLIIHNISLPPNEFGGSYINQFFSNTLDISSHPFFEEIAHLRVSSHLLIRRNGDIVQYVPFHKRAWHAGVSCYNGQEACNDFSIGIELEGADHIAYEPPQYEQLARISDLIIETYPKMSTDRIAGHCDIAPQRKTDPGEAFDWKIYRDLMATRVDKPE